MVKVVARNLVKKDKVGAFIELTKELVDETRKEDGCIKYELFQDEKDETILTFIEEWETKDALKKHFQTPHFKKIVPQFSQLTEKETDLNIYNVVL